MKKINKKGFTLIEILAVIVLIGLVATVGISLIVSSRNKSNRKLAQGYEKTLETIGKEVYVYESLASGSAFKSKYNSLTTGEGFLVSLDKLKNAGYLTNLVNNKFPNPSNKGTCDGFLLIKKTSEGPVYKGFVNCGGLYTTPDYSINNSSNESDWFSGSLKTTTLSN